MQMEYFESEYKKIFGETPSDTLQKNNKSTLFFYFSENLII